MIRTGKTRIFIYFSILVIVVGFQGVCHAGERSGGAVVKTVITPYAGTFESSVENIKKVKLRSSSRKMVRVPSKDINCNYAFFHYSDDLYSEKWINSMVPEFHIEGVDKHTGSWRKIPISDIEKIEMRRLIAPCRGEFSVTVFPAITPEELKRLNPSYSNLLQNYKKEILLEVDVCKPNHEDFKLILECTEIDQSNFKVFLGYLAPGEQILFSFDGGASDAPIWWAIESVTNDPHYPFLGERTFPSMSITE